MRGLEIIFVPSGESSLTVMMLLNPLRDAAQAFTRYTRPSSSHSGVVSMMPRPESTHTGLLHSPSGSEVLTMKMPRSGSPQ